MSQITLLRISGKKKRISGIYESKLSFSTDMIQTHVELVTPPIKNCMHLIV